LVDYLAIMVVCAVELYISILLKSLDIGNKGVFETKGIAK